MKKYLMNVIKDQTGSVVIPEILIAITGVVVVSGIILNALTSPLKALHEGAAQNITKISRGF